jgi:hypothetical protein
MLTVPQIGSILNYFMVKRRLPGVSHTELEMSISYLSEY